MVLLVAALVIGAIVWLVVAQPWRGWGGEGASAASAAPSASASASASPEPSEGEASAGEASEDSSPEASAPPSSADPAVSACTEGEVSVEPLTDAAEYAPDQTPQLMMRLTNRADAPCTINVGTTQQRFTISSGEDVWWRSTDCQSDPSDLEVTLEAGQVVETAAPIAWDRTRSSVTTCDGDRPAAPGGGATYRLAVSIGGIDSDADRTFLLY